MGQMIETSIGMMDESELRLEVVERPGPPHDVKQANGLALKIAKFVEHRWWYSVGGEERIIKQNCEIVLEKGLASGSKSGPGPTPAAR